MALEDLGEYRIRWLGLLSATGSLGEVCNTCYRLLAYLGSNLLSDIPCKVSRLVDHPENAGEAKP